MRPKMRKRFYQRAGCGDAAPYAILLEAAGATPAGHALALPTRALGEAVAAEWEAQREQIDPAAMPLTRLVNSIIDGVARTPAPAAEEVGRYLGSDLLCYRADTPEGLVQAQAKHWDPLLDLGARCARRALHPCRRRDVRRAAGPRDRRGERRDSVRSVAPRRRQRRHDAHRLGADRARAVARPPHGGPGWDAAHVDEDWNMSLWGRDELALDRRAKRFAEMQAAGTVLSLT